MNLRHDSLVLPALLAVHLLVGCSHTDVVTPKGEVDLARLQTRSTERVLVVLMSTMSGCKGVMLSASDGAWSSTTLGPGPCEKLHESKGPIATLEHGDEVFRQANALLKAEPLTDTGEHPAFCEIAVVAGAQVEARTFPLSARDDAVADFCLRQVALAHEDP